MRSPHPCLGDRDAGARTRGRCTVMSRGCGRPAPRTEGARRRRPDPAAPHRRRRTATCADRPGASWRPHNNPLAEPVRTTGHASGAGPDARVSENQRRNASRPPFQALGTPGVHSSPGRERPSPARWDRAQTGVRVITRAHLSRSTAVGCSSSGRAGTPGPPARVSSATAEPRPRTAVPCPRLDGGGTVVFDGLCRRDRPGDSPRERSRATQVLSSSRAASRSRRIWATSSSGPSNFCSPRRRCSKATDRRCP